MSERFGNPAKWRRSPSPQHAFDSDDSSIAPRPTRCACGGWQHFRTLVMDTVLPGTPEQIYNRMLSSKSFAGSMAFQQKFMDIKISDWEPEKPGSQLLTRTMTYMKPCSNAPSGRTECKRKDQILHIDFGNYVSILTTTCMPNLRSKNAFAVETRTCVTRAGAAASRLVVSSNGESTNTSIFTSISEMDTISERERHYTPLEKAMRNYIASHPNEFISEGADEDAVTVVSEDSDDAYATADTTITTSQVSSKAMF